MNFYGAHFEYSGRSSEDYGLIVASINESQNMAVSGSGAELITLFNKRDDRRYYIDTKFDGAFLEYDMEVFSEEPLSVADQRAITKWLFYQRGFKKLYVTLADDCDNESVRTINGVEKRIHVNCILTDPEKIEGGDGIHGYRFRVNCDSPTGWVETVSETYSINGSDDESSTIISVTTDTDLNEYVYPVVQINMGTGGDCTIINNTDSNTRMTTFKELPAGTTLRLNGNTNFITSGYYSKFYDRNFVRLLDGVNNLVVYGPVESITLEWENRSYV